jgi:thiol-disulfide isomerase/thioredoxin
MRGKVFVLDFWASWCNPCVEKFSILKEMASHFASPVEVIAVNVDDGSRLQEARKVIISQKLAWPNVINGLGEADPLWKVFGSTGDNRLSIPLYVVIDKNGVVRYAGNGGPDLGELRKRLGEVIEFR